MHHIRVGRRVNALNVATVFIGTCCFVWIHSVEGCNHLFLFILISFTWKHHSKYPLDFNYHAGCGSYYTIAVCISSTININTLLSLFFNLVVLLHFIRAQFNLTIGKYNFLYCYFHFLLFLLFQTMMIYVSLNSIWIFLRIHEYIPFWA